MLAQLVEEHFFLYLLLLVIVGIMLGIIGTYLISFILALYEITKFMFSALALSGGA